MYFTFLIGWVSADAMMASTFWDTLLIVTYKLSTSVSVP